MDRGARGATVYRLAETEQISKHASKCAGQSVSIQSQSEQENKVLERKISQQKGWMKGGRDSGCVCACVCECVCVCERERERKRESYSKVYQNISHQI